VNGVGQEDHTLSATGRGGELTLVTTGLPRHWTAGPPHTCLTATARLSRLSSCQARAKARVTGVGRGLSLPHPHPAGR
jgi:hypothetical protein